MYHVTHLAIDPDLIEEFHVDASDFATLPWLHNVYRDDSLSVYEIHLDGDDGSTLERTRD